jgi:peroxiredoxin
MVEKTENMRQRFLSVYLILVGLALILAGVGAFLLLPQLNAVSSQASQLSTVPVEVDYEAPDLSLKNVQGEPVTLAALRGKVVLVNLWATWCPPCKAEMPTLQAYYDKYKDQDFVVVAINDGDPKADVVKFARDYRLTFPVWLDPEYIATEQAFNTPNLPSSFVIDRQGIVRLRWVGEIARDMLDRYVTPIISE